jgi:hypothetical protein
VESLFAASLHISDFVQTQNEAKILTMGDYWPISCCNLIYKCIP